MLLIIAIKNILKNSALASGASEWFIVKKGRGIFLILFCCSLYYIRNGASVSVIVLLLLKYWGNPKAAVDISHL